MSEITREDVEELNGYMRLLVGILKMAIRDFVFREDEEARIWLFVEDTDHEWRKDRIDLTGGYSTSFEGICEIFNVNPQWLRDRIRQQAKDMTTLCPVDQKHEELGTETQSDLFSADLREFMETFYYEY